MLWFWFNCFDGYPNPAGPRAGSLAHLPELVSPHPRRCNIGSEKGLFCSGSDGNQSKVVQIAWEILRWTISTYILSGMCVCFFWLFVKTLENHPGRTGKMVNTWLSQQSFWYNHASCRYLLRNKIEKKCNLGKVYCTMNIFGNQKWPLK